MFSEIIHKNYREISQKVTEGLQRWNTLPISLQGRISIVKMNILTCLTFFLVFHDYNFSSTYVSWANRIFDLQIHMEQ